MGAGHSAEIDRSPGVSPSRMLAHARVPMRSPHNSGEGLETEAWTEPQVRRVRRLFESWRTPRSPPQKKAATTSAANATPTAPSPNPVPQVVKAPLVQQTEERPVVRDDAAAATPSGPLPRFAATTPVPRHPVGLARPQPASPFVHLEPKFNVAHGVPRSTLDADNPVRGEDRQRLMAPNLYTNDRQLLEWLSSQSGGRAGTTGATLPPRSCVEQALTCLRCLAAGPVPPAHQP